MARLHPHGAEPLCERGSELDRISARGRSNPSHTMIQVAGVAPGSQALSLLLVSACEPCGMGGSQRALRVGAGRPRRDRAICQLSPADGPSRAGAVRAFERRERQTRRAHQGRQWRRPRGWCDVGTPVLRCLETVLTGDMCLRRGGAGHHRLASRPITVIVHERRDGCSASNAIEKRRC